MAEHVDFGVVHSLSASQASDGENLLVQLHGQTPGGDPIDIQLTEGAGRALWSHVTQILYPRAADQLTQRIMTAVTRPQGARETTHMVQAEQSPEDDSIIKIAGVSREYTWILNIDHETGHDLWVNLEDIFDNV